MTFTLKSDGNPNLGIYKVPIFGLSNLSSLRLGSQSNKMVLSPIEITSSIFELQISLIL